MNRQQQRSEETRARILDAAAAAFADSGFDATSVAQICQAAGVTKGAFYHHYDSKKDVFLELLNRWLGGLDAQLESLRAAQASVPGGLLAMTAVVSDILNAAGGQPGAMVALWSEQNRASNTKHRGGNGAREDVEHVCILEGSRRGGNRRDA